MTLLYVRHAEILPAKELLRGIFQALKNIQVKIALQKNRFTLADRPREKISTLFLFVP